jgi:hypothetical protein
MVEEPHAVEVSHRPQFSFFELHAHPPRRRRQLIGEREKADRRFDHDLAAVGDFERHLECTWIMWSAGIAKRQIKARGVDPLRGKSNFAVQEVTGMERQCATDDST